MGTPTGFYVLSQKCEQCLLALSYPSVHLSPMPTGGISVKFGTGDFHGNLPRKSKFGTKSGKNIGLFLLTRKYILSLPAKLNRPKSPRIE